MSHTPGPWAILRGFPWIVVPQADAEKNNGGASDPDVEARQYAKIIANEEGTEFPQFHRSRVLPGEAEANARLIAAAPELLEALKAWERWYSDDSSEFNREIARGAGLRAIAKAEGVAPANGADVEASESYTPCLYLETDVVQTKEVAK